MVNEGFIGQNHISDVIAKGLILPGSDRGRVVKSLAGFRESYFDHKNDLKKIHCDLQNMHDGGKKNFKLVWLIKCLLTYTGS